jgi:UDP-N-acetylmuramate: L-alanyl-gamma-D-glutamyl-meso-diaminopimelate ligase
MSQRSLHFVGIGGAGMSGLALVCAQLGASVTGSDRSESSYTVRLRAAGIEPAIGHAAANVPAGAELVVSTAIPEDNPELAAARGSGAPVIHRGTLLGQVAALKRAIAVAGTHGKTTTTSILAFLLDAAHRDPGFLIGGVAENFGVSARVGTGKEFVVEADEYDTAYFDKGPKMWHYLPYVGVVNNIEFDHADIYRDEEAYRFAFSRFVNLVPRSGTLVAGWDSPIMRELAAAAPSPIEAFAYGDEGADAGAHPLWTAREVSFGPEGTRFTALRAGEPWGEVATPLTGAFNVRNCLAVIATAEFIGADRAGVLEGLRTFRSVKRRMEVRGEARGVTVIDDFAHHPTAVRETIDAVRQRYVGRPVVAVFEPRSYTAQRKEFQADYARAFAGADKVVLAGLFHPERYTAETAMSPHELVDGWRAEGKEAWFIPDPDEIVRHLVPRLTGGEVVLVMSNGGFGGIHDKLLQALAG